MIHSMESEGTTYNSISLNIDQKLVDDINKQNKCEYDLITLEKATDKCIAYEWLEHRTLGGSKYQRLNLTQKGFGVARSKMKSDELNLSRNKLKIISDYIENHKGLFILLPKSRYRT